MAAPETAGRPASGALRQYVSFTVGAETYGVDVTAVREIRKWSPTTTLPGQAAFTRGVLAIRGEALPVHDLKARFGGGPTEADEASVIVIVAAGGRSAGLLVDGVSDILDVAPGEICAVPEGARAADHETIIGLIPRAERLIALIDVAHVI
jgi:purine-binding chemotaxis protein CheW